ncbi:MAG: lytic murein transglycosylase [Alphaproteobacteria bacterium]
MKYIVFFAVFLSAGAGFVLPAAYAGDFSAWLAALRREAAGKGISQETVDTALSDVKFLPRVIELDRKQPEGTMSFAKYRQRVLPDSRINEGRRLYRQHRAELDRAAQKYGVPAPYIVALWGIETSYGENTGGFGVVPALATLAYDGRRSAYFRTELLNALEIIDDGHISAAKMRGSWAGAMGQNQFMPSSFKRFAVDGNGDGRRDIWGSLPDVFASTANYLSTSGWNEDQRWGREVSLPQGFPKNLTGVDNFRPLSEWRGMGVTLPGGEPLPSGDTMRGAIVTPDGVTGQAFLVYDNYKVIMRWNKSVYFATSVGLLADRIAQ